MAAEAHLFGVRHHGPGSAHALERALTALGPAEVLIEGPPEAEDLLRFAASPAMRPPLALLVYALEAPAVASFYPLAAFSPEWRAMTWAARHERPVRFIDLPYGVGIAERIAAQTAQAAEEAETEPAAPAELDPLVRDPLSALAEAAGYEDGESWWNAVIEQGAPAPAVFAAVEGAMAALRAAADAEGPQRADAANEARREAHMRLAIREAVQRAGGPVAVVVGAWHVPALRAPATAGDDRALLRGLKPAKVAATWTPWTDAKLAAASGYGAGVVSPGWYRLLWAELQRGDADGGFDAGRLSAQWCAHAAAVLRAEGQSVSTASLIEAARLATALAAVRERPSPGLAELRDASLAALCGGEAAPLRLLTDRLIVGLDVGEVDDAVPQTPLQADLARTQRRLRLKPEALAQELSLDLRSESGLERSILLHRLTLIRVPWGAPQHAGGSRGSFRERWVLEWKPQLSIALVEALQWGVTVASAAAGRAASLARDSGDLAELARLVQTCLLADIPDTAQLAMDRLQALAVGAADIGLLLEAVPPLTQVLRYGTARRTPEAALRRLVQTLGEQACVGLPYAARQLDEAAAATLTSRIRSFDATLALIENERLAADWTAALGRIVADPQATPAVAGAATRRLGERGALNTEETAQAFSRALSPANPAAAAAAWLEGFLGGEGEILLHDAALVALIDAFLAGLAPESFEELLPAFRRALANLDAYQRRRLLDTAKSPARIAAPAGPDAAPSTDAPAEAAFAAALPLLNLMLGLDA
jgi:hypothetical protein